MTTLTTVFNNDTTDIADRIRGFNWSGDLIETFAPSYNGFTSGSVRDLSREMQLITISTLRSLCRVPQKNLVNVHEDLMRNYSLSAKVNTMRSEKLSKSDDSFKFEGEPDDSLVEEVLNWFNDLVKDSDVLASLKIDAAVVSQIVAKVRSAVESGSEEKVFDIVVLQFPGTSQEYLKLYNIKLTAWSNSDGTNGIQGEYFARPFEATDGVHGIDSRTFAKASQEAEATAI